MIFSSKNSVRSGLKKHGIEIRERSQHHGDPAQVKYGQRVVQNSLIEHKNEKRAIDTINQMKDEGVSLRGIAQIKVPTKKRGKS
jgi:hypothetical protein